MRSGRKGNKEKNNKLPIKQRQIEIKMKTDRKTNTKQKTEKQRKIHQTNTIRKKKAEKQK